MPFLGSERDHFYAGCLSGPGFFAGRRFVATRALKARRYPEAAPALGDDPARGAWRGSTSWTTTRPASGPVTSPGLAPGSKPPASDA